MTTATTSDIKMTVEKREVLGKEGVKKLRRDGKIPAIVYGGGKDPVPIVVDEKAVTEILKQAAGENTIFLLKLKGTKHERRAMIKDIQIDPISRRFVHIDFIRIVRGHKVSVSVPIVLVGEEDSVGVRHGGLVDFVTREIAIEVLPREMPDKFEVDLSEVDMDEHVTVGELEPRLPESARLLDDPSRVVVTISAPRATLLEETEAEEGEEGEASLVIEEQAEPEVIKKGKDEETE